MPSTIFANERTDTVLRGGPRAVAAARERTPSIAFVGFESGDEARRAADAAFDALRPWLARQRRTSFVAGPRRMLDAEGDDRESRLTLHGIPIGRLIGPEDPDERAGYGFELMLPPGSGISTSVGAARVIDDALAAQAAVLHHERNETHPVEDRSPS